MDAISCCLVPLPATTSFADATSSSYVTTSHHHHHHYSPQQQLLRAAADQYFASSTYYYAPAAAPPPVDVVTSIRDDDPAVLVAAADSSSSPTPPGAERARRLGPVGARTGNKRRRSRASKRAPTTYISTDPSNFRFMVQQITGVQADDASVLRMRADDDPQLLTTAAGDHQYQLHEQQPCFPTLDSWNVSMDDGQLLGTSRQKQPFL